MQNQELYFRWEWQFRSSPDQLWPFVADTNRFNRDTGLPAIHRINDGARQNARQLLEFSRYSQRLEWEEEPFEWIRPQRFGVYRHYRTGPVVSLRVLVELASLSDGGIHLVYHSWVRPRSRLWRIPVVAGMELVNRRSFEAAFRRYDRIAQVATVVPEQPKQVSFAPGAHERLEASKQALVEQTGNPELVSRLIRAIETADDFTAARLRPYTLADAWSFPRRQVLKLCLHAARAGLFDLQWDVVCPLCRGAKDSVATLAEMKREVHCDTCNIDFGVNFDRFVELTFQRSPSIRSVETGNYCIGGPQVTPHIVAQQMLVAGERRTVTVPLEPGRYRVRALSLPGGQLLTAASSGQSEATLSAGDNGWAEEELTLSLRLTLHLENDTDSGQLFILERMAWSDQAATAAEVTMLQTFRDLFSGELLRRGERISVGSLSVLFTDLRDSTRLYRRIGDAPAFGLVLDHFAVLCEAIAAENGALIKTIGDAVMAVFPRPVAALRAILAAQQQLRVADGDLPALQLKAALHHGPCIAVTLNDRLDYFGSVVNMAARLERFSLGDDVIISDMVRGDPEVAELLASSDGSLRAEPFAAELKGFDEEQFRLWRVTGRE